MNVRSWLPRIASGKHEGEVDSVKEKQASHKTSPETSNHSNDDSQSGRNEEDCLNGTRFGEIAENPLRLLESNVDGAVNEAEPFAYKPFGDFDPLAFNDEDVGP